VSDKGKDKVKSGKLKPGKGHILPGMEWAKGCWFTRSLRDTLEAQELEARIQLTFPHLAGEILAKAREAAYQGADYALCLQMWYDKAVKGEL
jgi:hypothetical protein